MPPRRTRALPPPPYLQSPERVVAFRVLSDEEARRLRRGVEHVFGGQALRLRDVADLVVLGGARVERPAEEQLGHHAPEGPHVYRLAERQAEKDLGSPEDMAHR